jgi:ubiquinone/menaquinone biosynthesis C-methylase UbiE
MDDREVGRLWDANADAWTTLARMGCDIYRDYLNTPAFLKMLPPVDGLRGLDIGCGEGNNTRLVAQRGATLVAVDIALRFIRHARDVENEEPLRISYLAASGTALPFADESFDFAVAFMSLMDMPNHDEAAREVYRVLKPGGFLQLSILYPCFATPRFRSVRDESGNKLAVECGDYFAERQGDVEEWIFATAPEELRRKLPKFRVPRFYRTLSGWLNLLLDAGFTIERLAEPFADDETIRRCPHLADTRVVAYFLHLRCRKPAS